MVPKTDKGHWKRALCSEKKKKKKKKKNGIVGALHDSKFQNLSYFAVFLPVRRVYTVTLSDHEAVNVCLQWTSDGLLRKWFYFSVTMFKF